MSSSSDFIPNLLSARRKKLDPIQRAFVTKPKNALGLFRVFQEKPTYLNIITVEKNDKFVNIIDGQQRITMLHTMFQLLFLDKDFFNLLNEDDKFNLQDIRSGLYTFETTSTVDMKLLKCLATAEDIKDLKSKLKDFENSDLLKVCNAFIKEYENFSEDEKSLFYNNLCKSTWHVCEIDNKLTSPYEVYINMNSKGTLMHWSDVVKQYWSADNNYKSYEEVKEIFTDCIKEFPNVLTYFIFLKKRSITNLLATDILWYYENYFKDSKLTVSDEEEFLVLAKHYKEVIDSPVYCIFKDTYRRDVLFDVINIKYSSNIEKDRLVECFEKWFITTTLWINIKVQSKDAYINKNYFNNRQETVFEDKKSIHRELYDIENLTSNKLKQIFNEFLADWKFDDLATMRNIIKDWLATKPLYNEKVVTNPQIKFILEKINSMYESAEFANQEYTIEHIWPQHLKEDGDLQWAKPLDESIQMLGNLTLLQKTPSAPKGKQNANSIVSNKAPWIKFNSPVYQSGLYITTSVAKYPKFEEDEIKLRSAEFAEKFIEWLTF